MTKAILVFLAVTATTLAQGFAPDSVANFIYNFNITSATGGAPTGPSSGLLAATGVDYTLNRMGFPLTEPIPYTYTKTGPNTANLTQTDGIRTATAVLTFTGQYFGTVRVSSPQISATQSGTFNMSPIPQVQVAPTGGAPLVNISTRATLAPGQTLTPGFVVGGTIPRRVLIRAVGPTLGTAFGVAGAMLNPTLAVFSGQNQIHANDDWGGGTDLSGIFSSVGAFSLPTASRDAALVLTLNPGSYTAQVGGGAGEVLVEVYFVDLTKMRSGSPPRRSSPPGLGAGGGHFTITQ